MEAATHRPRWKTLLAFGIIYFVWGSTFFAIRVGVSEVPPFLFCGHALSGRGTSWFMAGRSRAESGTRTGASGSRCFVLAFLIFVVDYGLLFWAEQRVPSGIAAVMLATIPAFMALSEIVLLRTQKLTVRLALALLAGIAGRRSPDDPPIDLESWQPGQAGRRAHRHRGRRSADHRRNRAGQSHPLCRASCRFPSRR